MEKSITPEELETLKGIQDQLLTLEGEIGRTELYKQSLIVQYSDVQGSIQAFAKELTTKYGDCSINLTTGQIVTEIPEHTP